MIVGCTVAVRLPVDAKKTVHKVEKIKIGLDDYENLKQESNLEPQMPWNEVPNNVVLDDELFKLLKRNRENKAVLNRKVKLDMDALEKPFWEIPDDVDVKLILLSQKQPLEIIYVDEEDNYQYSQILAIYGNHSEQTIVNIIMAKWNKIKMFFI